MHTARETDEAILPPNLRDHLRPLPSAWVLSQTGRQVFVTAPSGLRLRICIRTDGDDLATYGEISKGGELLWAAGPLPVRRGQIVAAVRVLIDDFVAFVPRESWQPRGAADGRSAASRPRFTTVIGRPSQRASTKPTTHHDRDTAVSSDWSGWNLALRNGEAGVRAPRLSERRTESDRPTHRRHQIGLQVAEAFEDVPTDLLAGVLALSRYLDGLDVPHYVGVTADRSAAAVIGARQEVQVRLHATTGRPCYRANRADGGGIFETDDRAAAAAALVRAVRAQLGQAAMWRRTSILWADELRSRQEAQREVGRW